jgi:hypothetical protein
MEILRLAVNRLEESGDYFHSDMTIPKAWPRRIEVPFPWQKYKRSIRLRGVQPKRRKEWALEEKLRKRYWIPAADAIVQQMNLLRATYHSDPWNCMVAILRDNSDSTPLAVDFDHIAAECQANWRLTLEFPKGAVGLAVIVLATPERVTQCFAPVYGKRRPDIPDPARQVQPSLII